MRGFANLIVFVINGQLCSGLKQKIVDELCVIWIKIRAARVSFGDNRAMIDVTARIKSRGLRLIFGHYNWNKLMCAPAKCPHN